MLIKNKHTFKNYNIIFHFFNSSFKKTIPLPTKKEKFIICLSVHVNKPSMK
jgi:hypothetical protein